jgi:integrase/recombinase XerC
MSEIVESEILLKPLDNSHLKHNFLSEFLRLQISPRTTKLYAKSIDDFFKSVAGQVASTDLVAAFLSLEAGQAIEVVYRYRSNLQERGLMAATVNNRLAAIKSLVTHAQTLGKCDFNLRHVKGMKSRAYRDTTGVEPEVYRDALAKIDRNTIKGKRDYAITRLLWDNALRRMEIQQLTIGDFVPPKLWILGKGRTEKELIDLSKKSIAAIEEWLAVRGSSSATDPMFIAVDRNSYGMPISGRSIDRNVVKKLDISTKVMSPHKVRHSAITAALVRTNGNIPNVQKFSRHSKPETLIIYNDNRLGVQGEVTDTIADLV